MKKAVSIGVIALGLISCVQDKDVALVIKEKGKAYYLGQDKNKKNICLSFDNHFRKIAVPCSVVANEIKKEYKRIGFNYE